MHVIYESQHNTHIHIKEKKGCNKKKREKRTYLGQHLMFNSARRDSEGFLSMMILRLEFESSAMEANKELLGRELYGQSF